MRYFAPDDEVAALERTVDEAGAAAALELVAELAWLLRQKDTTRALALVEAADARLQLLDAGDPVRPRVAGRLALVRAEAAWLFGNAMIAEVRLDLARSLFEGELEGEAVVAATGLGDALMLQAWLVHQQGEYDRREACLDEALAAYRRAGDDARCEVALAQQLQFLALRDPEAARARLEAQPYDDARLAGDPAVFTCVTLSQAMLAHLRGDHAENIHRLIQVHDAAQASGQLRRAAQDSAANIAISACALGDLSTALHWAERGLEVARQAGWPGVVGVCLAQLGHVLCLLHRPQEAEGFLRQAVDVLQPHSQSNNYAVALNYLAGLLHDRGEHEEALDCYQRAEQIVVELKAEPLRFDALCGQARALSRLGRPLEAGPKAEAALAIARSRGAREREVQARRVLADIHRRHNIASPTAALDELTDALHLAATIEGFNIPPDLYEEAAAEHARLGDMRQAYTLALKAARARERQHGQDVDRRAAALQVRHVTERLRTEADHHRQLGLIQAQRADALQQLVATLEELGAVGREITSNLDVQGLYATLERHVRRLLDATVFLVHRLDADWATLCLAFGVESGRPVETFQVSVRDEQSYAARCARERQEIVADLRPGEGRVRAGTAPPRSVMFAPLAIGDRLLGVMSVQSLREHAYGERERAVFRTLCAYGAIALANAESLDALLDAESRLMQQNVELERMAVTDRLTGLYNRVHLDRKLQESIATAERYGQPFSIILVDVDHFKAVNDTWGHVAGDEVLRALAALLGARRASDIVGRWGGEEFLIVCPGTDLAGALASAEDVRAQVQAFEFPVAGRCTASFGVAAWRRGDCILSLTSRADRGLYAAKSNGRNCVVGMTDAAMPPGEDGQFVRH